MLKLFFALLLLSVWVARMSAQNHTTPTPKPRLRIYDITFGEDTDQECAMRYMKFGGAYLRGVKSPNLISSNASTIRDCHRKCCYEKSFECRSFSYFKPLQQCFLMNLTKADNHAELIVAKGYVHIQIMSDFEMTTSIMETSVVPEWTTDSQAEETTTHGHTEEATTIEEATTEPEFWTGIITYHHTTINPNALNPESGNSVDSSTGSYDTERKTTGSEISNRTNTESENPEDSNTGTRYSGETNAASESSNETSAGSENPNGTNTGTNNLEGSSTISDSFSDEPKDSNGTATVGAEPIEADGSGTDFEKEEDDVSRGTNTTTPKTHTGPGSGVLEESELPEKIVSEDCPLTCENGGRCEFRSKKDGDDSGRGVFCKCEKGFGGQKCETTVKEEEGFPTWIIIVVVIAGLLLIAIIVVCVLLQVYKKKKGEYKVVEWARIWARRGRKPKKPDNPGELAHVEEGPVDDHHNSPTTSLQSIQNSNASTTSV